MTPAPEPLYAQTHPYDLISRNQHKLELFNTLLNCAESGDGMNLNDSVISNGVYYLLDGISRELKYAHAKLMEDQK